MFSHIHEIVFHGNGGYDWDTVYNMPIWLRRFTYEKIKEHFEKQQEAIDKQNNIMTAKNFDKKTISKPDINPNYTTRAPKK